jgi:plasmid stabilization system protein ParE
VKYVLGAAAERDLHDIWEYIALDSPDAADRWMQRFFDAFEALGRHPNMGHTREDLTHYPILFWPVGMYLIAYRVSRTVDIVAVMQGSRDIPSFLRERARSRSHGA